MPNSVLGPFSFERILDYYDGPRLILQKTSTGQLILAWWNDEDEDTQRWLHLPVSKDRLIEILTGQITCLEALMCPEDGFIYVLDDNVKDESQTRTVLTDPSALLEDSLPYPDARFDYDLPEEVGWVEQRERAHLLDIRMGRESARTVSEAIGALQRLVDAIGYVLEPTEPDSAAPTPPPKGRRILESGLEYPPSMGRIPNRIVNQTRLNPVSAYSGSFGIRLESHAQDGMSGKSLIRSSLNKLFDMIEAQDGLMWRRSGVGSNPRVVRHYTSLLTTIAGSSGDVSLAWVKPAPEQARKVVLGNRAAQEMLAHLRTENKSMKAESSRYL